MTKISQLNLRRSLDSSFFFTIQTSDLDALKAMGFVGIPPQSRVKVFMLPLPLVTSVTVMLVSEPKTSKWRRLKSPTSQESKTHKFNTQQKSPLQSSLWFFIPLSELKVTIKWDPWLLCCLVTMTVSGLMDHRLFKAVSTSAAEALTAIGAKRGKDEETTCILGQDMQVFCGYQIQVYSVFFTLPVMARP